MRTVAPKNLVRVLKLTSPFLAAALSLLLFACGGEDKNEKNQAATPAAPAATVKAERPAIRDVPLMGEFTGRTDSPETVEIRARVEGFLKERLFDEGGLVTAGQPLFTIESRQYDENLKKAQADLDKEEAQLAKAKVDMERFGKLYEQKAVSRDEYDSKMSSLKQLEASVDRCRAAVETAKRDLSYTTVKSPIAGRVGKSLIKVGSLVGKGENTLLAEISSTDPIYVDFKISEREYLIHSKELAEARKQGKEPEPIGLTLILADDSVYPLKGKADMAERAVDAATGTLGVRGVFPNPDGILKPGQFAKVKVQVGEIKDAPCAPVTAIMDVQGSKSLFVVTADGKAESRAVTLGPRLDNLVVIESGIKPDDLVVVEGGMKLRNGDPVRLEGAASAAPGSGS